MSGKIPEAVTSGEMKRIDRLAIEQYLIPGLILMEHAGKAVADVLCREYPGAKKILVLCGKGNNGGDGFVAARHLVNRGLEVLVWLCADPGALNPDPRSHFRILEKMGIPVREIGSGKGEIPWGEMASSADVVVDALFGIGIRSDLSGFFRDLVNGTNRSGKKILAVDIPSGLDADTGKIMGASIRADLTVTLAAPKKGLYLNDGPSAAGKIFTADIGIPRNLLPS